VEAIFDKLDFNDDVKKEYKQLFMMSGYDTMNTIKLMTSENLSAIGIHKLGHKNLILHVLGSVDNTEDEVKKDEKTNSDTDESKSDVTIMDDDVDADTSLDIA